MNYAVMYEYCVDKNSGQFKAPFNQIINERRVFTYKDTAIVTPNSDTPYSFVLAGPAGRAAWCSPCRPWRRSAITRCSSATATPSTTATSAAAPPAMSRAIIWWSGPDWKGETPAGIKKVFHSSTQFSLAIFRTQLFNPDDMPNVIKVQAGYQVQPLSAYLHQPAPPAAPAINFPPINKDMVKTNFFQYLDFALQFAPAGPEEKAIRAKLARIGIGAGKTFNFDDLDLEHKLEVGLGMKAGENKVDEHRRQPGKNDQRLAGRLARSATAHFYNGDWLLRAAAAKAGIYGNDAVEAMYPMTRADADRRRRSTAASTITRSRSPPASSRR